jgi:predicted enzyme related to lactoylglutathione lyase
MADQTVRGRFLWHELTTADTAAAQNFYTKVLGWKTQSWDLDPSYTMFLANSGPVGGTSAESGQAQWISYIGTDDIEATVTQAQKLGAVVTKQISDMPNGGRYALLEDPQGASFGVYQSASEHGPEKAAKRGEHSWHELATDDYQAAFEFYSALFGWEAAGEHDMGAPNGVYFMFGRNGVPVGGIYNRLPEMPPPAWTAYVRVRDTQKVVPKATAQGATLIAGPMEVPGGDWIAQFVDPQGAIFAVHTVLADVKGAPPAQAANEESVTPEEVGAQRHDDAVSAAGVLEEAPAKPSKKKAAANAAKRPAKAAVKQTKTAKRAAKAGAKKKAKTAANKATRTQTSAKKSAKKKAARPSSKRAGKQRKSAARATKRPASKRSTSKRSKAKRTAARRPSARRASARPQKKASRGARRAK